MKSQRPLSGPGVGMQTLNFSHSDETCLVNAKKRERLYFLFYYTLAYRFTFKSPEDPWE